MSVAVGFKRARLQYVYSILQGKDLETGAFSEARRQERMYYWHALPDAWEKMDYQTFLAERRDRIARVIKDGYGHLSADQVLVGEPVRLDLKTLVAGGEGTTTEFKATLRVNLHTHQPDSRMELGCLKTIAGFLNSNGGTLLVGVTDDGEPVGIPEADQFPNEDKMSLHLVNLVTSRIGAPYMMYVHPRFEDFDRNHVMAIECWSAKSPVFVKDGSNERSFVRAGPSTAELPASQMQEYIKLRFG